MSLEKIEGHIKSHKHLPGIPSAKDVKKDGIDVIEMQAKLLEKIEELTLHMIDLKKENKGLHEKLIALESKL